MSDNLAFEENLDVSDLDCPMPIMRTNAKLAQMVSGDHLKITANNREYIREIHTLSKQMGHIILEENTEGEILSFVVQKR
jgi:tRNA 2-thiouridine synthesizing protein A